MMIIIAVILLNLSIPWSLDDRGGWQAVGVLLRFTGLLVAIVAASVEALQ